MAWLKPYAQNADSLSLLLKAAGHDTSRCNILVEWGENSEDPGEISVITKQLKQLAEDNLAKRPAPALEHRFKKYLAEALLNEGTVFDLDGNPEEALGKFKESLKLQREVKSKSGESNCLLSIGWVYENQSKVPEALECYQQSLKINEQIGNTYGVGNCLNSIASIYYNVGDRENARAYFFRCIAITDKGDKSSLAVFLNNIGCSYIDDSAYEKALEYLLKSLALREEIDDKLGQSSCLQSLTKIYIALKDVKKASACNQRSMKLSEEINDKHGVIKSLHFRSQICSLQNDNAGALAYGEKALNLSRAYGHVSTIKNVAFQLKKVYQRLGRYKDALLTYELYVTMRDSIANDGNKKASMKAQLKYEFDRKALADSLKLDEEKKLAHEKVIAGELKLKQERTVRLALYGGLLLVLVFAGFIFNRFKVTQKQKEIITFQKHLVEEKQKEVIESITYAKRLQEAILPPSQFLNTHIPDHFIFYKPKDIVAGDFYWAEYSQGRFFIAVADSTGHGVPGAMVSVVCSNALNRAVKEFNLTDTGSILDKTRELVLETFEKSDKDVKDGMDISLLSINTAAKKVQWSGANNALWYIQDGQFQEIKPDKQAIGKTENPRPFTTHEVPYDQNTLFYLFTDGLPDQFGGPKGKKFKYRQMSDVLTANQHLSLPEQRKALQSAFEIWKGDLEQVDDVCVMGIRLGV